MVNLFLFSTVGLAGGVGAVCRWQMDQRLQTAGIPQGYPIAIVNFLASLAIGLTAGSCQHLITDWALTVIYPVVATGFLGGFSTFSTHLVDIYFALIRREWTKSSGLLLVTWLMSTFAALGGFTIAATLLS